MAYAGSTARVTPSVFVVAAAIAVAPAQSQSFDIPAGPTLQSVHRLAAQAGIDVVVTADLAGRRSAALRGRMTTEAALDRLLGPAGARAVRLGDRVYRIEAAPAPPVRRAPPAPPPTVSLEASELDEVVITAPVRRGGLEGANGRSLIDGDALERARGALASEAVADLSASVDSTRQGPGRNKLFIRGVADSAFNGPLQATVGQYLGDLRLTYGSPDPDLMLIDVPRIDVFEGPQSSRFGSGSIGGVVRVDPAPAVLGENSAILSGGVSATSGGSPGADVAIVVNGSMGPDAAGRLVAYARHDGGFIDNPVRGVTDADHLETTGFRATGRLVREAWTVDAYALAQRISAGDAQTVDRNADAAEKTRRIAEPYDSTVTLVGLVANREQGRFRFTSATSVSRQVLEERFDASLAHQPVPAAVDRRQTVLALSSEARLAWQGEGVWSWNGGAALVIGETRAVRERREVALAAPGDGADLRREFTDVALFGELVAAPATDWRIAVGGRLSIVRAMHEIRAIEADRETAGLPHDGTEVFFAPTVAVRWGGPDDLQAFARIEQGVRPGSVSEASGVLERYRPDRVTLFEAGFRTPESFGPWSAEVSVGHLDWRSIQADVVTLGGDLITDNIGDGVVRFIQGKAAWTPDDAFSLSGGLFLNDSEVRLDGPNVIGVSGGDIPNVAKTGAQLSVEYDPGELFGQPLRLGADLRYVGPSRPGFGPGLDVPQGDYVRMDLAALLGDERRAWSLRISNPFDTFGIRYGVGSPYQLTEPQGAALRPLTVRLGFETAF